jgi:hypothetical protein
VFGDDDLRRALLGRVSVVGVIAVDEGDDVAVLFEGAGFAQVGEHGPLVGPELERLVGPASEPDAPSAGRAPSLGLASVAVASRV